MPLYRKANRKIFDFELTAQEYNKLNEKAKVALGTSHRRPVVQLDGSSIPLHKGASIAWSELYSDRYVRMHLPGYPFERNHCWYPIPEPDDIEKENEPPELNGYFYGKRWAKQEISEYSTPIRRAGSCFSKSLQSKDGFTTALRGMGANVKEILLETHANSLEESDCFKPDVEELSKVI